MLFAPSTECKKRSSTIDAGLSGAYKRWFEIIHADTPALQDEVYRLRYQVYCCENQFENPDEHLRQLEMDVFDTRSIHSLIIDRASGMSIGTVRLIRPDPVNARTSLPIQRICHQALPGSLLLSSSAEISRFAISKKMRKTAGEELPRELKCSVVLGLMRAIVQMSLEYGITDWLAVMEPSLLRLLSRFGIYFSPLGPLVEHHGMRQPCHANVPAMLERVQRENFGLWEFVTESGVSWDAKKAC